MKIVGFLIEAEEIEKDYRKFILNKYPYKIFYKNYPEIIVIVAIAHHKRKPNYWKSRIN